ncbi:EAL domain-containing protein [Pseudoalteromonas sp. SSDWG2]|uniref:two-component system response regulator n=1 Tax=Pseudoalteromonas sp. SSDWG2 TaxID=3139391 RepID=UPI003BA916A0
MNQRTKILVIDDEVIETIALTEALSGLGEIYSCNNSCVAIQQVMHLQPDIVLLDLEMPMISGFDILAQLAELDPFTAPRVLVITSHSDHQAQERALQLGAIDFISKPVHLNLCRMRVQNHIYIINQQKSLALTKEMLFADREQLRVTLDCIADGVISTDDKGHVIYLNPVAQRLTGWSQTAAQGRFIDEVMTLYDAITKERYANPLIIALKEKRTVAMALNTQITSKHDFDYRVQDSAAPIIDSQGCVKGAVMVFQDISETLEMSVQMTYLSHHDQLTALPNRVLLYDRLAQNLARAEVGKHKLSLLLIDIDNFKYVNDALGHHIGDDVIAHIGHNLDRFACSDITVARVGGDEFAIVVPHVQKVMSVDALVSSVFDEISKPFRLGKEQYSLSASIGVSVYPDDALTIEDMMRHADSAMYKAKQHAFNSCCYFSDELQQEVDRNLVVGKTLRSALRNDALVVHYQPKYNLQSNQICGAEGLVRVQDADGKMIAPFVFIEYAEESGLIYRLGEQVLNRCCCDAKQWLESGYPIKVAVNISAKQFSDPMLTSIVAKALEKSGLPSCYLELEVTESALVDDYDATIKQLTAISKMGVSIALDDFGTGYSSLSYLRLFPLDVLKIDQSFVSDMLTNNQAFDIVHTIIQLAGTLNLQLVAEGIETQEQRVELAQLGCATGQGYLMSRPMSADEFAKLLCASEQKECKPS